VKHAALNFGKVKCKYVLQLKQLLIRERNFLVLLLVYSSCSYKFYEVFFFTLFSLCILFYRK
jgi:hypothetical protein